MCRLCTFTITSNFSFKTIDKILLIRYNSTCQDKWALSSVGRASALQAGGHRFEPCSAHHLFCLWPGSSVGQNASLSRQRSWVRAPFRSPNIIGQIAQSVEQGTENPRVGGSIPSLTTNLSAGIAQLIERCLAKAEVAGLSPVSRSILYIFVIKKYIFNIIY